MPSLTWIPGMLLGSYRLLREIARGGMGEIWLAHQQGLAGFERIVVIKRVIAGTEEDSTFITLFLDEARIASQLHHPNVVQVFDLGQHGSSYYLVMEYLSGQNLARVRKRLLKEGAEFPPAMAVEIISAAARGLGYAHRRKDLSGQPLHIVHRDVSPANLFITYDGQVKVLDFGIAKAAGRLSHTQTGIVRGKLKYMSPEQAFGDPINASADVFALGVMLFELLTNTRLYDDLDEPATLRRLGGEGRTPRASERAPVDPRLDAIVARMLERQPANRFADGQQVHEALEGWLRTQTLARSGPSLEMTMRACFAQELAQEEILKTEEVLPGAVSAPRVAGSGSNSLPNAPAPTRGQSAHRRAPLLLAGAAVVALGATLVGLWLRQQPMEPTLAVSAAKPAEDAGLPSVNPADLVDPPNIVVQPAPTIAPQLPDSGATEPDSRPVAAVKAKGRLTLETDPWTRVWLGKRPLGDTPLVEVVLPAGPQRLHLVNEEEHIDTWIVVDVRAGATTVKKLSF